MSICAFHFIDFHTDATHAICGWEAPADYAGVTVYMSSATCPQCIEAIQRRLSELAAVAVGGARVAVAEQAAAMEPAADLVGLRHAERPPLRRHRADESRSVRP